MLYWSTLSLMKNFSVVRTFYPPYKPLWKLESAHSNPASALQTWCNLLNLLLSFQHLHSIFTRSRFHFKNPLSLKILIHSSFIIGLQLFSHIFRLHFKSSSLAIFSMSEVASGSFQPLKIIHKGWNQLTHVNINNLPFSH